MSIVVNFKPTANNVHTMFSTTRPLSSVVCPVGGGGSVGWRLFVQLKHVGKSIGKDWAQPVKSE